jgi:hypothetical protein
LTEVGDAIPELGIEHTAVVLVKVIVGLIFFYPGDWSISSMYRKL